MGIFGRIPSRGSIRVSKWQEEPIEGTSGYGPRSDFISGPAGKLWYSGMGTKTGIIRVSTSGAVSPGLPANDIASNLVGLPDGQVWFETTPAGLGVATRSGIVVTQDLRGLNLSAGGAVGYPAFAAMTAGPDGNLWLTTGGSSIQRISGLDSVLGGLDYRHRPKRSPDYYTGYTTYYDYWTNVTTSARPTFAGVATPGSEVTIWAQKQGESQPLLIGQATASTTDGSWTLKSHVTLSNGYYAVTANQTGDTRPPSVLYSLAPDSSGNLSNALVIQSRHNGKGKA
jgi:hypothetical protein